MAWLETESYMWKRGVLATLATVCLFSASKIAGSNIAVSCGCKLLAPLSGMAMVGFIAAVGIGVGISYHAGPSVVTFKSCYIFLFVTPYR